MQKELLLTDRFLISNSIIRFTVDLQGNIIHCTSQHTHIKKFVIPDDFKLEKPLYDIQEFGIIDDHGDYHEPLKQNSSTIVGRTIVTKEETNVIRNALIVLILIIGLAVLLDQIRTELKFDSNSDNRYNIPDRSCITNYADYY